MIDSHVATEADGEISSFKHGDSRPARGRASSI